MSPVRRVLGLLGVAIGMAGLPCGCGQSPPVATQSEQHQPEPSQPGQVQTAQEETSPAAEETPVSVPAVATGETPPAATAAAETPPAADTPPAVVKPAVVKPAPVDETSPPVAKLGIGDPAPPLQVDRWFTGEPLAAIEPGQVQVVEFWATWCGPCLSSMPHISELQEQYGEQVRFVGVTREEADVVEKFLDKSRPDGKTWRDAISYRLARDDSAQMNTTYMRAAGQNGIPCAFIVGRDGVVEWIGHPMRIDQPLARVVDGSWDRAAAIAEARRDQQLRQFSSSLSGLFRKKQWDEALDLIARTEQELGPSTMLTRAKLSILRQQGRNDEAKELQAALVEQAWDDPQTLNAVAWSIATAKESGDRDLTLARKAAERANDLRQNRDAAILDTLARVCAELGQFDEAIRWQRQAVEHGGGRTNYAATLKEYEDQAAAVGTPSPEAVPAAAAGDP